MNAHHPVEAVCECGHRWRPQKPPEEMADGPRCSECGAREEEISIVDGEPPTTTTDDTDSGIVRAAKRERRLVTIRDRVDRLIASVSETAPEEAEAEVACEVREPYTELQVLNQELDQQSGRSAEISLAELSTVQERLDTIEQEIEEYSDDLTTIDSLEDRISELEEQCSQLSEEVDRLTTEQEKREDKLSELNSKIDEKGDLLNKTENREDAWKKGYDTGFYDARDEFEITIPCADCGRQLTVKPWSPVHDDLSQFLQNRGWRHGDC